MTTFSSNLEHVYKTQGHQNALDWLNDKMAKRDALSKGDLPLAHFYKGKCIFHIQRGDREVSRRTFYGRGGFSFPYSISGEMSADYDGAIACFEEAVRLKKDCAEAHFWKGKAFSKKGEPEKAFSSYCKAASISDIYAKKCNRFFSENQELSFDFERETLFSSDDEAISASSSPYIYTRMRACASLKQKVLSDGESTEAKEAISRLAGTLICGFLYLPFTGDSDPRIQTLAREILNKAGT